MKKIKIFTPLTFGFLLMMFVFNSCSNDTTGVEEEFLKVEEADEKFLTMQEFEELSSTEDLEILFRSVEETMDENVPQPRFYCPPCNPHSFGMTVYNLGGNNRGFGVNTSVNGICDTELNWYPDPGVTVNWTVGNFAMMTFPGPGTYEVWINFVAEAPDGSVTCVETNFVVVTI